MTEAPDIATDAESILRDLYREELIYDRLDKLSKRLEECDDPAAKTIAAFIAGKATHCRVSESVLDKLKERLQQIRDTAESEEQRIGALLAALGSFE